MPSVFCGKDAQAATKLHPENADDSLTMEIFYIYTVDRRITIVVYTNKQIE